MATKVTRKQLLEACDLVAKTTCRPVARGFRPGRGLRAVRRAIKSLPDRPLAPGELCLPLVSALMDHEPWDVLPHHLLEPLFDGLRVLARWPDPPRSTTATTIGEAKVTLCLGDMAVRGDLFVRGTLLVAGSLRVSGAIHALGEEWYSGTLLVLGDVHAARMNALGPGIIAGTLALKQGLSSAYYHDTAASLVARRIEAPIWFDRGDIAGRVRGTKQIARRLRFQKWLSLRLPKYFDGESRKVKWQDFDAAFYRAAIRAADAQK